MKFDILSFPQNTGVYLMKDKNKKILYIGKAKNLKKRISTYFFSKNIMTKHLLKRIDTIDTIIVNTEKEALILENNLIKQHKPIYNILLKDDKTFISIVFKGKKWPKLQVERIRNFSKDCFGPYTDSKAAKTVINLILKLFPLRQCSNREFKIRKRACILFDIKKCLAPCVGKCSHAEYMQMVFFAKNFLQGKSKEIIQKLKKEIHTFSKNLEFEKAQKNMNLIKKIQHVQEIQKVENVKEQDFDAIGMYEKHNVVLISQLIFRNFKLIGSDHFVFFKSFATQKEMLQNFLMQNYKNSKNLKVFIPIKISHHKEIEKILKIKIQNASKQKNIKYFTDLAFKNAKTLFEKEYFHTENILLSLQKNLNLINFPKHIICFDISSLFEKERVGAMVTFINGKKQKSKTKLFKIKTDKKGDIYALEEILIRHFSKIDLFPDLLLLDGGLQHLNIAIKTLKKLNIASIDIASIAKEKSLHTKGLVEEKIFLPYKKEPLYLPKTSKILFFLQQIRDEAHKNAIFFHRKRRKKTTIKTVLENIPNIGKVKINLLLTHFKSIENIKKASQKEIESIKSISKKDAKSIFNFLKNKNF